MKDFPVFTTENGVASILLKEVTYRQTAYIRLQSSQNPQALLSECIDFCVMCGAKKIYAEASLLPEDLPYHHSVVLMRGIPNLDAESVENIFPVTEQTVSQWRSIYNERMRSVDGAATLEAKDEAEILQSGGAYFVHHSGELLGIGWLQDGELKAIASCQSGCGYKVANTLLSVCPGELVFLQVASTNEKAIALYEHLGLIKVQECSRWADVSDLSRKNT